MTNVTSSAERVRPNSLARYVVHLFGLVSMKWQPNTTGTARVT
jgi:hypothetical protein